MTDAKHTIDKASLEAFAAGAEVRAAVERAGAPAPGKADLSAALSGIVGDRKADPKVAGPFSPWPWAPEVATCARHGKYKATVLQDGTVRRVPHCTACVAEAKLARTLGSSGIPPRFQALTLAAYRATSPGEMHAWDEAQRYIKLLTAAESRLHGHCLILTGHFGTGKTHLACGIGLELIKQGFTVAYFTTLDLVRAWRASWAPDARQSEGDVLRAFVGVDLLILEEIGRQKDSEAERGHLFEVLDGRYGHNRPTIVTSNYPASGGRKSIEGFLGQAAYDRLYRNGCTVVRFDWDSYTKRGQA
jgi:DNA replication protein DnaC